MCDIDCDERDDQQDHRECVDYCRIAVFHGTVNVNGKRQRAFARHEERDHVVVQREREREQGAGEDSYK